MTVQRLERRWGCLQVVSHVYPPGSPRKARAMNYSEWRTHLHTQKTFVLLFRSFFLKWSTTFKHIYLSTIRIRVPLHYGCLPVPRYGFTELNYSFPNPNPSVMTCIGHLCVRLDYCTNLHTTPGLPSLLMKCIASETVYRSSKIN